MIVERHGKTVMFSEGEQETIVKFTKTYEATNFRNAISLGNKKTFEEATDLIKSFNGQKL